MTRYARAFAEVLAPAVGQPVEEVLAGIGTPPKPELGHFAYACFPLAKERRAAPPKIAAEIADAVAATGALAEIKAVGPYVNAFVDGETAAREILPDVLERGEAFGRSTVGAGGKVPVDFSSPNIAKPFGIHHLRSTVIGHALVRMLRAAGYEPVGINHIGDWGTQFGQLLAIWEMEGDEDRLRAEGIHYLLGLYVEFNKRLEDQPELRDVARERFRLLESGDAECRRLWALFREVSLAEFERVYGLLGITFDDVKGESFYEDLMAPVLEELAAKDLLRESEDATLVELGDEELGTALVRKRDGSTLYLTRDLAAADYRWRTYAFDRALYVVGGAQSLHFAQMKRVLELLGREWHDRVIHTPFGMMRFTDRKMSTRKGDIIYLEEVLERAIALARETMEAGARDKGRALPDDLDTCAHRIGVGAVVFNDLKNRRIRDVTFDWDTVLEFEGETGPYLQYTAARIASMGDRLGRPVTAEVDFAALDGAGETRLLLAIDGLEVALLRGVEAAEPSYVADQLLEIASLFSTLYARRDWKVISDDEALTDARMLLATATRQALLNGLDWLGIEVPDRM